MRVLGPNRSALGALDVSVEYSELEVRRDGAVVATVNGKVLSIGGCRLRWGVQMGPSRTGTVVREDGESVVLRASPGDRTGRLWAVIEVDTAQPEAFAIALLASAALVRADADIPHVDAPGVPAI